MFGVLPPTTTTTTTTTTTLGGIWKGDDEFESDFPSGDEFGVAYLVTLTMFVCTSLLGAEEIKPPR